MVTYIYMVCSLVCVCVFILLNLQPFHMAAAALNAFHNIWLRTALGRDDVTITVRNHPLPRSVRGQVKDHAYP